MKKLEYQIGTIVYLVTDIEQRPFIITRVLWDGYQYEYEVCHSDLPAKWCHLIELSITKDIVLSTSN